MDLNDIRKTFTKARPKARYTHHKRIRSLSAEIRAKHYARIVGVCSEYIQTAEICELLFYSPGYARDLVNAMVADGVLIEKFVKNECDNGRPRYVKTP